MECHRSVTTSLRAVALSVAVGDGLTPVVWMLPIEPASAYPIGKLVGVAIIDDVAYLVYETPSGGYYFEEL